ncbi:elongator complex protein 4 [Colletotrichum scovillei]|uniref:Elongator complex protein 4 n=1 Tax=Colletotrichum scovillei TaxID=1209932 RepID=A0A9P7U820_9PEZI|nr:elongator complex protein 4 [Colletotrichum scovillei]KAG7045899.1 elongator complex protein 4 [Colletotrichum scovillei]KAG7063244.1 elongator complex protein 4 [Colletotrichum scovillei]
MSFRKKNVVLGPTTRGPVREPIPPKQEALPPVGTRSSPLDGRPTTSTGTASLDQLLAGHAGLPLGYSILVEESGTTDFSGVLLRYYAAEGLVQGQQVHVLGPTDAWRGELPGLGKASGSSKKKSASASDEKMKIAWRYESLGNNAGPRTNNSGPAGTAEVFCHSFDLGKRLQPSDIKGELHATPSTAAMSWLQPSGSGSSSPLDTFISNVSAKLKASPPGAIHRIVVPSLLSPALYGSSVCRPADALQFLHKLRALLRQHEGSLTAMISLSTSLFPRSTGFTRWMELLCDGVLEMLPLPRKVHIEPNTKSEDVVQGMLKVHSLPVYHERGGGIEGQSSREDLSFRMSSSSGLIVKPYVLPPLLDEGDGGQGAKAEGKKGEKLDF